MGTDRLGNIFIHMKDRCYNQNSDCYKNYGGRGITICDEWYTPHSHKGSRAFRKWALENGYREDLTIERIDVNKGYSPGNCKWISKELQNNNKRNNRYITYNGKTKTMTQWCRELNISSSTVRYRLSRNKPVEKVFNQEKFKR